MGEELNLIDGGKWNNVGEQGPTKGREVNTRDQNNRDLNELCRRLINHSSKRRRGLWQHTGKKSFEEKRG